MLCLDLGFDHGNRVKILDVDGESVARKRPHKDLDVWDTDFRR